EFGIARRYSTDSDELIETVLMYRLPEQEDWVVYDPVAFDRGVGVSHDPWGQMVIDTLLTLGISAVARSVVAEAAELYALEEAGVTVMHSGPGALLAGVYRMVRGSGGGVTYVRLGARFGLASEGSFVARHASGLVSYIRTGVTGRIERVRATLLESALRGGTTTSSASRVSIGAADSTTDAGHILGRLLGGGDGANSANLFAQLANINRGMFARWEGEVAEAVAAGSHVSVDISILYAGRTQPIGIIYEAVIDGVSYLRYFPN
ncbi:MAG TPA: DNA/RNA non-specific endonuclease, partial [Steroidobacteraceae bacterium]|nr:DNA/RNA non-specific endonuclease [Steroidobacteraceae bacterium]